MHGVWTFVYDLARKQDAASGLNGWLDFWKVKQGGLLRFYGISARNVVFDWKSDRDEYDFFSGVDWKDLKIYVKTADNGGTVGTNIDVRYFIMKIGSEIFHFWQIWYLTGQLGFQNCSFLGFIGKALLPDVPGS